MWEGTGYYKPFGTGRVDGRALNILGHHIDLSRPHDVIVHVTIRYQGAVSYRRSIVTESVYPAVLEIMGPKHIGVMTLTFQDHVTSSKT